MSAVLIPEVIPPETAELKTESLALVRAAESFVANVDAWTNAEYEEAGRRVVKAATTKRGIELAFKESKAAAYAAHKAITKLESDLLAYPAKAESLYKAAMATFYRAEESRRREAETIERARLQREAESRRLEEAAALAQAGEHDEAEALVSTPVVIPVVELPKPVAAGVTMRKVWKWRVTDAKAHNLDFMVLDEKKASATVKALGPDAARLVGGIEVYADLIPAVSTNG